MVEKDQRRSNGRTAGEEAAKEAVESADRPLDETTVGPSERTRWDKPGFSEMPLEWRGADADTISKAFDLVEQRLGAEFQSAYTVMFQLYDLVREPELGPDGQPLIHGGVPVWKKRNGDYVEDWTKMTRHQRETFLFRITTRLFEWEQKRDNAWGESMFAKALWEDNFALGYENHENPRATEKARTARGNLEARQDRYFAVFKSLYARRADSIVRALSLLGQRLKDVHQAS